MERQTISSGAVWEPVVGYSRAVRVGPWISVSGTTAAAAEGGAVGGDDAAAQTREALRRIAAALQEAGAGLEHVVRTRMFVTDISRWQEVGQVHGEVFAAVRPATSMVEVSRLIDPALLVEVEADALVVDDRGPRPRLVRMWSRRRVRDAERPSVTVLLPRPLRSEVVRLRDAGQEVDAVRLVRRETGLGLVPAYRAVVAAQHELPEHA